VASLNKDLFGNIPVTPVTDVPVKMGKKPPKPDRVQYNMDVYHASRKPVEEFTKAPIIHVGTADQAADMVNTHWQHKEDEEGYPIYMDPAEVEGVHGFDFSEHVKIHPPVFPDPVANEAHARFLEARGYAVPPSVTTSRLGRDMGSPLITNALKALNENKVIKYDNTTEGWAYHNYEHGPNVSYVVPTPYLNLKQFGQKEKWEQQPLPMDYTETVPHSETTSLTRLPKELRQQG
jgi:hypothetical protein